MSSAVDIQIVSTPNLERIENFFKDASYRESIEFSANFNTRLCIERRLRLPFLDPQTGVAQNHSQLFVDRRQRMPGFRQGQIYTYPAARWRKSRRQYLNKMCRFPERPFQALRKEHEVLSAISGVGGGVATGTASPTVGAGLILHDPDFNGALLEESSSLGAAGGDTSDSKDSQQQQQQQQQQQLQGHHHSHHTHHHHQLKDELPKEWFYDDLDMNDADSLEEPKSPPDDEYDYDPRYGIKKRRKRRLGKRGTLLPGEGGGGGGGGSSGGGGGGGGGSMLGGSSSSRRRSGMGRGRVIASTVSIPADSPFASLDATDAASDVLGTPTSSGAGRRPRGSGTRGRRRAKNAANSSICDPPSPGMASEPPSFESAAAAVGVVGDLSPVVVEEHGDLRGYRKYL